MMIANLERLCKSRFNQAELFTVNYHADSHLFQFSDNRKVMVPIRKDKLIQSHLDDSSAIYRGVFNPNIDACGYVAAGGIGWLRVECLF
jgi:hypothetical protein